MKEQNKEIDLLWESFYFYTEQISKEEITREDNLEKFNYLLINEKSISASRKSVFLKYFKKCNKLLIHLYHKQKISIKDLINFANSGNEIPKEYDVNIDSLNSLLELTSSLIEQTLLYQKEIDEI